MSEQQREHLSALVDGEIDPALVHPTVSGLESNASLKASWERYHLIGAAMRSEPVCEQYRRIALLVRERIAEEPVSELKVVAHRRRTSRFVPFAGAALAATAAFFAVFAVPKLFDLGSETPPPQNRQVSVPSPERFRLFNPTRRWHVVEPALESKLDRFFVNHQEQSPVSGMKGFLPYATVVGYETTR